MNSRRYFFKQLTCGLVAAASPELFIPKLEKVTWKRATSPMIAGSIRTLFDEQSVMQIKSLALYFKDMLYVDQEGIVRCTKVLMTWQVAVIDFSDTKRKVVTLKFLKREEPQQAMKDFRW